MRVLVCGGRDFDDYAVVAQTLSEIGPDEVIHGAAKGADTLAGRWAERTGISVREFPADWSAHGRAAGPIRNKRMLTDGHPDLVVAFPGGRGTENMVKQAQVAGIPVRMVHMNQQDAAQNEAK